VVYGGSHIGTPLKYAETDILPFIINCILEISDYEYLIQDTFRPNSNN